MTYLTNARIWIYFVIIIMVFTVCGTAEAKPVFLGAQGFGTDTRAAYGAANDPVIFVVTDLTTDNRTPGDSTRNGVPVKTGSFLEAVNYTPPANTGKIIIFEVSGTIGKSNSCTEYRVTHPYTTIAGQTAPSPGVLLKNCKLIVREHDVLVQHIRCRGTYILVDSCAISVGTSAGGGGHYDVHNVVIDHCSASWSGESNILVHSYHVGGTTKDITISNCIASEGIAFGESNWGKGSQVSQNTDNVSYIGNLFAHNYKRNPYVRSKGFVSVNNMAYNCGVEQPQQIETNTHRGKFAFKGNVVKAGPWYRATSKYIMCLKNLYNGGVGSNLYLKDQACETDYVQLRASDWSRVKAVADKAYADVSRFKMLTAPIWPAGLTATSSGVVEANIIANVGARPADRDAVDSRIINDVINGTGNRTHIYRVPGWPTLAQNYRQLTLLTNPHGDDDGDGYTNLEEWLHQFAAQVEGSSYIGAPTAPTGLRTE